MKNKWFIPLGTTALIIISAVVYAGWYKGHNLHPHNLQSHSLASSYITVLNQKDWATSQQTAQQFAQTQLTSTQPLLIRTAITLSVLNNTKIRQAYPGPIIPSITTMTAMLNKAAGAQFTHTNILGVSNQLPSKSLLKYDSQSLSPYSLGPNQIKQAYITTTDFVQHYWGNNPYTALAEWDTMASQNAQRGENLGQSAAYSWLWRYTNAFSGILPTRAYVLHDWVTYTESTPPREIQSGDSAALFPINGPNIQIAPFVLELQPTIHVVQTSYIHHQLDIIEWSKQLTIQTAWIKNSPQAPWKVVEINNHLSVPEKYGVLITLSTTKNPQPNS